MLVGHEMIGIITIIIIDIIIAMTTIITTITIVDHIITEMTILNTATIITDQETVLVSVVKAGSFIGISKMEYLSDIVDIVLPAFLGFYLGYFGYTYWESCRAKKNGKDKTP